jgi:APA family basic amino acid/polyamine antiporter
MRVKNPEIARPFKTPLVPFVPLMGILICAGMIVALDVETLKVAGYWMVIGLLIYFGYSRRNSHLHPKK